MAEIVTLDQLPHKIEFIRSRNKNLKIIATNGCFDILHVGHIRYLQKARQLGDVLIVGINSDSSVKKIKGLNRPLNLQDERAEVLASLSCVDIVSIFNEETAEKFLILVKPDIYVKGGDYDPDNLPEAPLVKSVGAKVVIIPFVPGYSTTSTIERLKKN